MLDLGVLFGLLNFPQIWLAIPLAIAFSLTYAGTRAEKPLAILARAGRVAFWLFFLLALVGVIQYFVA